MNDQALAKKMFGVLSYIIKKELHPQNTVTFFKEINCTEIEKIRNFYQIQNKNKPSYTAFIIKAVAKAVEEHPYVNARIFPSLFGKYIYRFQQIDMAVACEKNYVDAEFFAFADVVRNIDKKNIENIHDELVNLANCNETNNQQLKSFMQIIKYTPTLIGRFLCTLPSKLPNLWEKYRGAGLIISSPAKYGVDCVSATWTHPIGISFGLVQKKPMIIDGEIKPVLSFTLTLNFDRRIIAGAPAARFMDSIAKNLTNQNLNFTESEMSQLSVA